MQSKCIWIVHVDKQELYMYMHVVTRVHTCYMTLHVHVHCVWMHVYRYNLETDRFGTAVNCCWTLHADKHFWGQKTKDYPLSIQQSTAVPAYSVSQCSYIYMWKSDCLGCAVLLCLVCLFDLACFFLSSFSSLI